VTILERLDALYAIGGGEGANRPGLSTEELEAHELFAGWAAEGGLEVTVEPWGTVARLRGSERDLPEVWTGSHLDTVPRGGRFDGALGVVAGLEAVLRAGTGRRTLAVVAFRDEEGWRFGRGCFGSGALAGQADLGARDAGGVSVREALAALGLGEPRAAVLPGTFVEAHVEQGPVLERREVALGVVTAIAGQARGSVEVTGRADHAGTTPMDARDDALCAAAELVLRVRDAARRIDGAVATVGSLEVEPGASNVVPGRVTLTVDARAPDAERLDALVAALALDLRRTEPVAMAERPRTVLAEEIAQAGLPVVELASGAGHDAAVLAAAGVETGMLFVRSLAGGASHSPNEDSSPEDVALCVDVLAATLGRLVS
jgi:hydantoinase/carbamoylase family amidase